MRWTAFQVAEALGISPPQQLERSAVITGVSIDSRTVGAGELFVAIRGPRHDGHGFVASALERGAVAGLVARARLGDYPDEIRGKLFVVDDTLVALQQLAAHACKIWRKARTGRLIGAVAGSVGKTTTKEIFAALLGARHRVLKTQGNLNNEYGLPLTLLKLSEEHDAAVVELGMSHTGELAQLTRICSPDVGVVTRVAVEHLEFFSSLEEIALAERELIENLPWPNATAVLNSDDERVARFADVAKGAVIRFGTRGEVEFRAEAIEERGIEGAEFDLVSRGRRTRLEIPLIGRHNVMNALAALAAASVWGIGADEAKEVFPGLTPADKRGEVVRFEEGFTVINDTYNSSPTALSALATLLAQTPGYRRRILASGLRKVDWILGVQGHAANLVAAAIQAGHPREKTAFFENSAEAGKFLSELVMSGDLVLLKGSRGVRMEKILEVVSAHHRQSEQNAGLQRVDASREGRN